MDCFKIRIISKGNVADNTGPIGKDGKLIGIAEMPVDVQLQKSLSSLHSPGKNIIALSAKVLVKRIAENGRDGFLNGV